MFAISFSGVVGYALQFGHCLGASEIRRAVFVCILGWLIGVGRGCFDFLAAILRRHFWRRFRAER